MLVIISDIHLTDGSAVRLDVSSKQMEDFWHNIVRTRKRLMPFAKNDDQKIELVVLGDFFDLLRSNEWEKAENRGAKPWSSHGPDQKAVLSRIVDGIFERNKETLRVLKAFVTAKQVDAYYMLGNHDHLLLRYPDLFQRIHSELGFRYPDDPRTIEFYEKSWPQYGVLAHHGDKGDPWNDTRGLLHPIGDAMVTEVYNRFPFRVSTAISGGETLKQALENLVFVRPYRYAPFWLIQVTRQYGEEWKVKNVWNQLVEEFLEVEFVKMWMQETRRISKIFNPASTMAATLKISLNLQFRGWLSVTRFFNMLGDFMASTPRSVRKIRDQLIAIHDPRIRYLVTGHTHSPGMIPLTGQSRRMAYVNTGTWTRVWLPDRMRALEPGSSPIKHFTPADYICYAMFYTKEESPHQDMEFWTGRIAPRNPMEVETTY